MHVPNPEFQPMHAFAPYLLSLHQSDLLAEAELRRRARLAAVSHRGVPAWRRMLGGGLAFAARVFDPSRVEGDVRGGRVVRPA